MSCVNGRALWMCGFQRVKKCIRCGKRVARQLCHTSAYVLHGIEEHILKRETGREFMPLLSRETDVHPADLLDACDDAERFEHHEWAVVYTISRREKSLSRHLLTSDVPFYCPVIARRTRSTTGRVRESFVPLLSSYMFLFCTKDQRVRAFQSNCISRWLDVPEPEQLVSDLRNIRTLIDVGAPLTPEAQLQPGEHVMITSGPFSGIEGQIVQRRGQRQLIVSIKYLQQGVSVLLDEVYLQKQS